MIHTKFLLLCFVLFFCQNTYLYAQDEKLISSKKLVKDFEYLEELIEAHPDPYTHISKKEFKTKVDSVKATLDHPHSVLEFYKKTAFIVALIRDGHSSVRFPYSWLETQRKKIGAFPYKIHLTNENELYIIESFNGNKKLVGAKILSLNGISVDSFLKKIDPYISYEIIPFRNTIISLNFEAYLYLAFGHADNTKIEYSTGETSFVEVKNIAFKEWKKFQRKHKEEREAKIGIGEPYAYKNIGDGVGLINIYAFTVRSVEDYKLFLHTTFKKIRKDSIHSLIIDVRGNFGGWPRIASYLFHYISDSYFKTMAQSRMKVSNAYKRNLLERFPQLRTTKSALQQRRHFIDLRAVMRDPLNSYVDEEIFFNEEPKTEIFEFKGDCYLLTNRHSYSAASSFASTFQCYQMGVIIGEETGGTKIFRAHAIYEKLIRSELMVGMSTTKLFTTCYNKEFEGIEPTIKFTPSINEIISGIDTQLLFTQRLIKKIIKNKQKSK